MDRSDLASQQAEERASEARGAEQPVFAELTSDELAFVSGGLTTGSGIGPS